MPSSPAGRLSPSHRSPACPLLYSELIIAAILLRSRDGLEWFTLKNRSLPAQLLAGLLLAAAALSLTACGNVIYHEPAQNFAGRPIPPSGLLERVMAAFTANGSQGGLEILDGLRDIRSNVQNTIPTFSIKGFSAAEPTTIINYPEQTTGYVLSYTTGALQTVDYSTEASTGSAATFAPNPPSVGTAPGGVVFAGAEEGSGAIAMQGLYGSVTLNLPNVYKVVVNQGGTVVLAMVRNSNALYRVVKLPATTNPVFPPGYVDCEPLLLPVYCVVPVGNTSSSGVAGAAYDNPGNAVFSVDGNSVYILNCGPECGGNAASVTVLQEGPLVMTNVPTVNPLSAAAPTPLATLPVANPIPVPGGATAAIPDGTNLYVSGQQLQSSGLFAGNLSLINLTSYAVGPTYSISDGTHTKMLFADNNTLWIGSQQCANGQRASNAANGVQTQAANYNCLSRFTTGGNAPLPGWTAGATYVPGNTVTDGTNVEVILTGGTSGKTAPTWSTALDGSTTDNGVVWVNVGAVSPVQIIPIVTPNNTSTSTNIPVLYQNTNLNSVYYGDLNGECWVQNFFKVYTAYGGQIHAFNTTDGSEINNFLITVQGTVLDVAYMDAESNSAN